MPSAPATGVHFVGSIPLSTTDEVLTTLCQALPNQVATIPDGETGPRANYIVWERERFPKETIQYLLGGISPPDDHLRKFTLDDVKPTLYAEAAIQSYQRFRALRSKGVIPPGVRFQVALPLPYDCIQAHIRAEWQAQIEPLYEKRMFDALDAIVDAIPAEDLAIQIDTALAVMALEYAQGRLCDALFKPHFSPIRPGLVDRLRRFCARVPDRVPFGLHLCYGDMFHYHFIQPRDLGLMVDFASDLARVIRPRALSWVHMPVPKDRDDEGYFRALGRLDVGSGAKVYLGLVHAGDEQGTRRRIQAAQAFTNDFGVATECGMGRTPTDEFHGILRIMRNVTGHERLPGKL
ncbi:hypothetical protein BDW62DRAFT_208327 [Aspergillus aurantiobrunneus]